MPLAASPAVSTLTSSRALFQVISLNTNIYYRPNEAIDPKEADPGQQFSWLRDQLKNASTEGYKVSRVEAHGVRVPTLLGDMFHGTVV